MRIVIFLMLYLAVWVFSAHAVDGKKIIDMTYPFAGDTLYWPTAKPFHLEKVNEGRTAAGYWYSSYDYSGSELENDDAPGRLLQDSPARNQCFSVP